MKKYILTLILALASLGLYAQTNRNKTIINAALHGWEYEIKAGVNHAMLHSLSPKKYAA